MKVIIGALLLLIVSLIALWIIGLCHADVNKTELKGEK